MSGPESSSTPAGVPSNNSKYVLVLLLLLLGTCGIVVWKFVINKTDPTALTTPTVSLGTATMSAPTNPKLDDIPPPPPLPPPTASASVVKPTGPAVAGGGGAFGCDAKCTGSAPPDLASALQARAAQARRCYNSALAQDSTLKGNVTIAVKIAPNGGVCGASVARSDMPTVAGCVAGVFRGGNFPAPRGGCIDTVVPMSFVPAGGQ